MNGTIEGEREAERIERDGVEKSDVPSASGRRFKRQRHKGWQLSSKASKAGQTSKARCSGHRWVRRQSLTLPSQNSIIRFYLKKTGLRLRDDKEEKKERKIKGSGSKRSRALLHRFTRDRYVAHAFCVTFPLFFG